LDTVKEILRAEGAKYSREIALSGGQKGRWSSNKYSNVALDHLFHMGEIGIAKKTNSQKCFDVIENLFEEQLLRSEDPFTTEDEFLRWYILRRIGSIGMLWSRNGGGWLGHFISDKKKRDQVIRQLVEEDCICPIQIEGVKDQLYIRKENSSDLQNLKELEKKEIRILAPLDNLLWDRGLVEVVFDFNYSWEVYVPQDKRKYGYYVLPVMYGENIIARFEPVKSTLGEPFQIKNWWWEEKVDIDESMIRAIKDGLQQFSFYLEITNDSDEYMNKISTGFAY
ncbi:MAG: winged helix DNA-binding domain-containing protein, partial [Vallitaleaceae bacterium]|nr:winged helix DNA-binding domain-containing protein [Vallitaleaceae bacterium]